MNSTKINMWSEKEKTYLANLKFYCFDKYKKYINFKEKISLCSDCKGWGGKEIWHKANHWGIGVVVRDNEPGNTEWVNCKKCRGIGYKRKAKI